MRGGVVLEPKNRLTGGPPGSPDPMPFFILEGVLLVVGLSLTFKAYGGPPTVTPHR